jgi:hypothetical protein
MKRHIFYLVLTVLLLAVIGFQEAVIQHQRQTHRVDMALVDSSLSQQKRFLADEAETLKVQKWECEQQIDILKHR